MRLLALVTDGFGAAGGIARYNCDLMTALGRSKEVEQVVVFPRFGGQYINQTSRVLQLEPTPSAYIWAARALTLGISRNTDAIFCGHLNFAPLAAHIARLGRKPLWIQTHGIEAWEDRGGMFRKALKRAKLVTSVSRYTRRRLLSWSDLPPQCVRVLPNTFESVSRPLQRSKTLDARYNLNGRKVILTVGRLAASEAYKGHDRIIRCLRQLNATAERVVYLIVGSGNDQIRLKTLVRELGLLNSVIFAGSVPAEELGEHYALADVFAMPSTGEGFGIVFLEAAAAGLPIIGGNCDGSLDPLADGVIGMTIDPNDPNSLLNALMIGLSGGIDAATPHSLERFNFNKFANHVSDLVNHIKK
jgi:phosphatidylinositol alpha-1,6-mannosyltransferase